ncbi:uncharacterized protein [Glycine max]|uniref:uncharacterized protein n=1 Tax=Glycine max TaxID=3847 RepID=UPI0003DE820A|nr:uncharacterized protein LOC102663446 [Glycine max]|eukprot:XP_006595294.1 uncharacterized protein LOC102663446 [Glycine max]
MSNESMKEPLRGTQIRRCKHKLTKEEEAVVKATTKHEVGVEIQDQMLERLLNNKNLKNMTQNSLNRPMIKEECQAPNQNQSKGRQDPEANLAKGEDDDVEDNTLLLMMTTNTEVGNDDTWYLDSGCSNHMTGHKEWLVSFDMKKKSKVKFVDNRVIEVEGTSDVLIQRKD